ncbi:hypothetical protein ACG0Z6_08705 [Roseateles sp. BYS180W]|uniref:Histone n=1 Tax=Roseateles rivi TaxID=3299028 RepID=A0ABW7FVH0_9BURK
MSKAKNTPADSSKVKLVRDSFTMPKDEYAKIDALKQRAAAKARVVKKSEILRAGVALLDKLSDTQLLAALSAVPSLKTGRPKLAEAKKAADKAPAKTPTKAPAKKAAVQKAAPKKTAKALTPPKAAVKAVAKAATKPATGLSAKARVASTAATASKRSATPASTAK